MVKYVILGVSLLSFGIAFASHAKAVKKTEIQKLSEWSVNDPKTPPIHHSKNRTYRQDGSRNKSSQHMRSVVRRNLSRKFDLIAIPALVNGPAQGDVTLTNARPQK